MAEQGQNAVGDWVVVRRPGVVRLADSVVKAHNSAALTRHRGDTMIALAETLAASRVGAEVRSIDPDGAKWSMKITVEDTAQ
jgi:hypothetical protein